MDSLIPQIQAITGLRFNRTQAAALARYEKELMEWNSRFNLTAIRTPEEIRVKHFLDSLTCALAMRELNAEKLVDVGTGAGFPGLVLKLAYPALRLTLVESVGKKMDFCRHVAQILGLEAVQFVTDRAEALGQQRAHREQYDWAVARAVAPLPVLLEYLLPLVRRGGAMLAMKGESGPAEALASRRALHLLGGQIRQLIPVTLPGVVEERYLIVIDKVAATPPGYPRRVGIPSKDPLGIMPEKVKPAAEKS